MKRAGISVGTAWPRTADKIVITIRAGNAAENTNSGGYFIAMSAAMRKVLSPISENTIMVRERRKECRGRIKVDGSVRVGLVTDAAGLGIPR